MNKQTNLKKKKAFQGTQTWESEQRKKEYKRKNQLNICPESSNQEDVTECYTTDS